MTQLFQHFKSDMKKIIVITIIAAALTISAFHVNAQESDSHDSENGKNQEHQDFSSAYNKFEQDRQGFVEAKNEFEKDDHGTEESVRVKYVGQSQKVLVSTINVIVQRNRQLKDEIDGNENYYGNVGKDISGLLDQDNQKLGDYISEVNLASTTPTLNRAASEIKTFRLQQQSYLRKLIISAHMNRYEDVVIKTAQSRSKIIEDEINLVKNQGKDISSLEGILLQANFYISQATSSIGDANDIINQQAIDSDGLTKIQEHLDDAEKSIKSAYQLFKQIAIDGNILFSKKPSDEIVIPVQNSTSTATSTQ